MTTYKCDNGRTYMIPSKCCLTCDHCTDVYYDSKGPYLAFCDKGDIKPATTICIKWRLDNGKETIL